MKFKAYIEEPRMVCEDRLLKKLRNSGFKTNGYSRGMEKILTSKGFGLPVQGEDGFCFTISNKWFRSYLNYADALAQEILLLLDLKLLTIQ